MKRTIHSFVRRVVGGRKEVGMKKREREMVMIKKGKGGRGASELRRHSSMF
jgi:hypothetical protein